MLAMKRAVEGLRLKPAKVLVDGNRLPQLEVLSEAIVGGDAKVKSISAASIIAKVTRDRMLTQLHEQFPQYGFAAHKGYGTPEHLEALRVHGACIHHRRHFSPVAATFTTQEGATVSVQVQ
jgi:ribonuclease HII